MGIIFPKMSSSEVEIIFSEAAQKNIDKLPSNERKKLLRSIGKLRDFPFAGKKLTGEYTGLNALKVWPFRVFYRFFPKQRSIVIVFIRHRQDAYK